MTLDDMLRGVVVCAGSDLHLQDGLPPKIRVHGELESAGERMTNVDPRGTMIGSPSRQRLTNRGCPFVGGAWYCAASALAMPP